MATTKTSKCEGCGKTEKQVTLERCPTCFKPVCGECAQRMGGRNFCSRTCARFFFFEDEDE